MVHYGKHIIDPQTGLCEICDRGAINDLRRGKRTGKQFLYSNQDGKFTYRPNNDDGQNYFYDEPTPRHNRKPTYPVPPAGGTTSRSRHTVYEEPKRHHRRETTPPDESPRRQNARSKVFYEVDDEGQMNPRYNGPPDEPRRRYLVQPRRAETPPPTKVETWNSRPRRQNNSDSEAIDRHYRPKPHEIPRQTEVYYLDANQNGSDHSKRTFVIHDNPPAPTRPVDQRKRYQLEPIDRKHHQETEPIVERKIYRKLPAHRNEPPPEIYASNGEHLRLARKVETIYPTPRHYDSTPMLNQTKPKRYTTLYHVDAQDAY